MSIQKPICSLLILSILLTSILSGCAGHSGRTVDRYIPGDENKSCPVLLAEIDLLNNEIILKDQSRKDRDFWNTMYFVSGFLVIVPFFFMDTKGSHEAEIEAFKARRKMLKIYLAEKNCPATNVYAQNIAD